MEDPMNENSGKFIWKKLRKDLENIELDI